jgi:hypothetical protein
MGKAFPQRAGMKHEGSGIRLCRFKYQLYFLLAIGKGFNLSRP